MNKIINFADGTIYVQRPGTRWGRVKMQLDPIAFSGNEVMYCPVQDSTPPKGEGKGHTIKVPIEWFKYLDNFHTEAAHYWLWTPNMLWTNRNFVGDAKGSTLESGADPQPIVECITGPNNIRRIIGETETHYEVWSLPVDMDPSSFDPAVFNWRNYPWIFWKAQARTATFQVQNVGKGLDVFHLNLRNPIHRHYMHKNDINLFAPCPFVVSDGISRWTIIDYMFVGASIYGITDKFMRVPLLLSESPGQWDFPTDWRCTGPGVIPPVAKQPDIIISPPIVTPPTDPTTPPIVTTEWPRFARVKHWHERYQGPDGRGLSYIAAKRQLEGDPTLHPLAGGDPAVFQLNQSSTDRPVSLTPDLEKWIYRLDIESSQGKVSNAQVRKTFRNKMHGGKAFTNRTGWSNGYFSAVLGENPGADPQRLQLTIANGATIKVIGPKTRRGGVDVYPIEVLNAQDPNTVNRTLKDAWWMIFAATNSTIEPAPEGRVEPFPHLENYDVMIPLLANNTTVGYIEAGWVEFLEGPLSAPVYPYYQSVVTEEQWKQNRRIVDG